MALVDCFLYFNEIDLLIARLELLNDVVDRFVIVESAHTFTGKHKGLSLKKLISSDPSLVCYANKIIILENHDYLSADDVLSHKHKLSNIPSACKELNNTLNSVGENVSVWLNDTYQREYIQLALNDQVNNNDTIIISDIDEIPNVDFYTPWRSSAEFQYASMQEYRYSLFFSCPGSRWRGAFKAQAEFIKMNGVNLLRFYSKRGFHGLVYSEVSTGWHFTSFGSASVIQKKINAWGHQELNTFINRQLLPYRIRRGFDIFSRSDHLIYNSDPDLPVAIKKRLISIQSEEYIEPKNIDHIFNYCSSFLDRFFRKFNFRLFKWK